MKTYQGKSVFGGVAVGNIKLLQNKAPKVEAGHTQDVRREKLRFEAARLKTQAKLKTLYHKTLKELGEAGAAIFEMQSMLLDDPDYLDCAYHLLEEQQMTCEYAIFQAGEYFAKLFGQMETAYLRERASDVRNVASLMAEALAGKWDHHIYTLSQPAIVVADTLTPSEAAQLDKSKVLALVTSRGSVHSHTSILARIIGVPALVGVNMDVGNVPDRALAIVDGEQGVFIVEPDEKTQDTYGRIARRERAALQGLQRLKGQKTVTAQGSRIELLANAGSLTDVEAAIQNDAEGIGLFRSEFLYLNHSSYPSEDEQFAVYAQVAQKMKGKKVVIRTVDLGADKQADYFDIEPEVNPALGYRGIRLSLDRTEMFRTQLRALLRASHYGNIAVLYPMIVSEQEVDRALALFAQVRKELLEQGIQIGRVEQGIMIETPAAALISDLLTPKVDFFSIGTNDLTQYTLAADRQNPRVEHLYNPGHPAVLRMIQMVVSHAHRVGKRVCICGEAAADLALTKEWVSLGVDGLSVAPPYILPVREAILKALNSPDRTVST